MKVVTCGFSLYRRNRELHALSIIGLNCQDKKKKKDLHDFIFTTSCKLTNYERKTINHQASTNV